MKYKTVKKLEEEFRRLTGVKLETFDKMAEILRGVNKAKKRKGGRNHKLRRHVINGAGIFKGIPNIFPCQPKLRGE